MPGLQGNRKTLKVGKHPDRNDQFLFINQRAQVALDQGQPVISVDIKKKELVGNDKNGGKDYRAEGDPVEVKVYDFIDEESGKVSPYGVYDIARNEAWVNVGVVPASIGPGEAGHPGQWPRPGQGRPLRGGNPGQRRPDPRPDILWSAPETAGMPTNIGLADAGHP